jgi:hypothetical protein
MYRSARFFCCFFLVLNTAHAAEEIINERIEWSDVWVVGADADTLPRVLLVGDSIVKGYYNGVEKALEGKANCARFATSKFLAHPDFLTELGLLVDRFSFDVIHINNGLHGWGYTEDQYRAGLDALFNWLKQHAPNAKIVWCQSTPVRDSNDLTRFNEEKNARVLARNQIAADAARAALVPVNDLYALVADLPDYFSSDGVHFSDAGRAAQATHVAAVISDLLAKP